MMEAGGLTGAEDMIWSGDVARIGAEAHPDRPALIVPEDGVAYPYREFDRRIGRSLSLLADLGLKPGDRVGYLGRNRDLYFVLLIAAMRGGYIMMPLNWRCRPNEIQYFLSDSGCRHLFCDRELRELADAATAGLTAAPTILDTRPGESPNAGFANALEADGAIVAEAVERGDMPCMLYYTSGTSGRPKGALSSHYAFSIMRYMEVVAPGFPVWEGETCLSAMPAFHIAGTTWPMQAFMRGSTVVLTSDPSAPNLVKLTREHGASRTFAVPTVIREIVREVRESGVPLPTLKWFFYGAMPIGESLLRDAMATLGCSFLQYYGMTEVTGSATFLAPRHHDLARPDLMQSVGQPFPGAAIDIRDADGRSLPPGQAGEIYIRTPTIMSGYWGLPDATAEVLRDGWYRTGDGGRLSEEGFLYLTDRIKDMIVSGGENIYPAEVEEVLRQHGSVKDVVLIARPDERWGEAAVALVELKPGAILDEADMIAFCKARLANYKAPKAVFAVDQLPRTASGKLQRAQARKDFLASLSEAANAT
ncbi:MAG: class I adenylate-forming enzyme family protein [Allosphingosinicella sp.]|uniref:class I adenylate-forming enzyme family protein n=1 Tax=Allosphingosinicella sp. TaxID=2823234 RepID=UPI0039476896